MYEWDVIVAVGKYSLTYSKRLFKFQFIQIFKKKDKFIMPRPKTKEDLIIAAKENYEKLNTIILKMSDEELNTPFDFIAWL